MRYKHGPALWHNVIKSLGQSLSGLCCCGYQARKQDDVDCCYFPTYSTTQSTAVKTGKEAVSLLHDVYTVNLTLEDPFDTPAMNISSLPTP